MNLNDLYEMRDPRDAYQRDVANSTSGFGKDSQAYRADGGANDENHALDQQSSTWYIRLNNKLIRDKQGNPYSFQSKVAANKAALTMQAKLFNKDKEFMLTTNPNDKLQGVTETQQLSVKQLATISDAALDKAYGYGRSQPGNSFGWQANLKSAAFAKQMIDKGVTDIEAISDAIHKGWNTTAQAFVQNPEQFDDTAKLKAAGKLEAKLQQRAQLMKQNYGQLPEEEKEKDRVVARALLQALKGEQDMAEGWKEKVAAATLAGTMALGAAGAGATGLPGGSSSVDQSAGKPVATQVAPTDAGFINRVQAQHRAMEQMNPQYAKDHAGLNIAMVRGIGGGSDVKNQQWAQKTAQLLQKYGAQVKEDITTQDSGEYDYEGSLTEDLQADDGEYYSNSAKFFGQFEADHFDNEETSPDGMEIRGYIDGANVMAWRFKSAKKIGGWGIYDDSALEQGMAEAEVDSNGHSVDHADSGEYDYEGDQAKDQLNTIVRAARRLDGLLDDNENMPEWVQMKITNAADYIDTAADYIESNQEPELEEGERGRGRPPSGEQDTTPVTPGRVEKTATGIRHHADASRYGGTEPDAEDDHLMSKSHISRLGKMTEPDIDEGEKVGNMDADKFDSAMARLKQLAGAGPMKTVYDPTKRVYRNVPVAVQPKK